MAFCPFSLQNVRCCSTFSSIDVCLSQFPLGRGKLHPYLKHCVQGLLLCATIAMPLHSHAVILPPTINTRQTSLLLSYENILPLLEKKESNHVEVCLITHFLTDIAKQSIENEHSLKTAHFKPYLLCDSVQILRHSDLFYAQIDKMLGFMKNHKKEVLIVVAIAVTIALAVIITVALVGAVEGISTVGALTAAATEVLASEERFEGPQLSPEEEGRILGSLLVHEEIEAAKLTPEVSYDRHRAIDEALSTNYTPQYTDQREKPSLSARYFQSTAEKAYESGYYEQTIYNSNKAIELAPSYPAPYFDRSLANFELEQYDEALSDYHTYVSKTERAQPFSTTDFSIGFAKGLPRGIYDSGEALVEFTSSAVAHPIQTGQQVRDSFILLTDLVRTEEWETLTETLAPEVHQLIAEWDELSSIERGELAGYAFGKYGADVVIPGAAAKGIAKGAKVARTLKQTRAGCEIAERVLVLEVAAEAETNIARTSIGESISKPKNLDCLTPELQDSFYFYEKAQQFLKPYKGNMTEEAAKELIRQTGLPTFSRPKGIPENFRVQLSDKGGGIRYIDPCNPHNEIRVMPGKPHSPLPYQQKPYVVQKRDGKALDRYGNLINKNHPEAHIPVDEFVYQGGD